MLISDYIIFVAFMYYWKYKASLPYLNVRVERNLKTKFFFCFLWSSISNKNLYNKCFNLKIWKINFLYRDIYIKLFYIFFIVTYNNNNFLFFFSINYYVKIILEIRIRFGINEIKLSFYEYSQFSHLYWKHHITYSF